MPSSVSGFASKSFIAESSAKFLCLQKRVGAWRKRKVCGRKLLVWERAEPGGREMPAVDLGSPLRKERSSNIAIKSLSTPPPVQKPQMVKTTNASGACDCDFRVNWASYRFRERMVLLVVSAPSFREDRCPSVGAAKEIGDWKVPLAFNLYCIRYS